MDIGSVPLDLRSLAVQRWRSHGRAASGSRYSSHSGDADLPASWSATNEATQARAELQLMASSFTGGQVQLGGAQ